MLSSPVAKKTPAPTPHCVACEGRMKVLQAHTECAHLQDSFMCITPGCPRSGHCTICIINNAWFYEQNEEMDR